MDDATKVTTTMNHTMRVVTLDAPAALARCADYEAKYGEATADFYTAYLRGERCGVGMGVDAVAWATYWQVYSELSARG